ncbi:MAG: pseudouridine synthase [Clostridia bacterium]|nr:pseudouridine synthase [Clostridia bacterium]
MKKQRLDRFISNQLNLPRSMSKTQIHRGKVTVDGIVLRDPSSIIDVDAQTIFYKNEKVNYNEFVYILMNKPKGVLSATEDKSKKTVIDLIPQNLKRNGLFPVGRLDKDTTGLLIITDDGDFAHKCIHPSKNISKTYIAKLDGALSNDMVIEFAKGVVLADKTVCKPAVLGIIEENVAKITITEGKYHQIKRMFGVFGLGVEELKRESIGALRLPKDLDFGECILLNGEDLGKIWK